MQAVHRDIKPENMLLQKVSCSKYRGRSSAEKRESNSLERFGSQRLNFDQEVNRVGEKPSKYSSKNEADSIFVLKVCDLG